MSEPPSPPTAGPSRSQDPQFPEPLPVPPLTRSHSHHSTASKRSKSRHSTASKPISRSSSHNPTNREVLQLLADAEIAVRDLRADVSLLNSQLSFEQERADNAEFKAKEACIRFKNANDTRLVSQGEVVRLTEELRLYKDALEQAQKEIFRAQGVLKDVEGRRREAEEEAAKLRSRFRKVMEGEDDRSRSRGGKEAGPPGRIRDGEGYGLRPREEQGLTHKVDASDDETSNSKGDVQDSDPRYTRSTTPRFRPEPVSRASSSENTGESSRPHSWIPEADASLIIRLPPPHELQRGRRTPSPIHSSPGSPLHALPIPLDDPVLMVPEPRTPGVPVYAVPASDSRHSRAVRRRASVTESIGSTRTSELELLSPPEHPANRSGGLSVIPEVMSVQEQSTPGSRSMRPSVEDDVDEAGFVHVSMPATRSSRGSVRRQGTPSTVSASRSPARDSTRPISTSSSGTVGITIQPPSRPASNMSQATASGQRPYFLSPADADRPLPSRPYSPGGTPSMAPLPPTGSTVPIGLPGGQLPPGFVPIGPPTPASATAPIPSPVPRAQYTPAPKPIPAPSQHQFTGSAIPIPCSPKQTHQSLNYSKSQSQSHNSNSNSNHDYEYDYDHHDYNDANQGPAVIPPPSQKFAPESDESSSSDTDTLTRRTPPRKYRAAGSAASLYTATGTPRYSAGGGVPLSGSLGSAGGGGGGGGGRGLGMGVGYGRSGSAGGRERDDGSYSSERPGLKLLVQKFPNFGNTYLVEISNRVIVILPVSPLKIPSSIDEQSRAMTQY
ncbi:uncharacterized protein EDB91DRAFT_1080379 [Suillus paluster]|uniref:uncharacterized protein n=1 Tax=Suillus paluster TaxID=48578 RepID=UPI001B87270E|nr:uncharacterized protein EDB91DRAFT_1080379 [Suillus paluster]KAG1745474.1 hypothetical protein EDB91DRAFT_1080379 [Suillus paluster]